MDIIGPLVEAGAAAVAAAWLLKRRSEEAALEAEPIPVPVRSRH
jgi:hypothetical protein